MDLDVMDADVREQLFDLKQKLKNVEDCIRNSKMSERNKATLEGCKTYLLSRISTLRSIRYLYCCKKIAEIYDKDFQDYTKADCDNVVNLLRISPKKYKENTINDYIGTLQMLFKYIDGITGKTQSPRCAHLIKKNVENKLLKENLVTEEQVNQLIDNAPTLQYKCILSLLFESGARPAEIRGIRLKDITKIERGYKIIIDGKTGIRPIFSITSAPLMTEWLQSRAIKEKDMPLFYIVKDGKTMFCKHHTWSKMLDILSLKVLGRKIPLYRLRHSRATILIQMGMQTAKVKNILGHARGSDTLEKTYLHLDDTDLENSYADAAGLPRIEQKKIESTFVVKTCKCGVQIASYQKICEKCGSIEDQTKWMLPEERNKFSFATATDEEKAFMREEIRKMVQELAKQMVAENQKNRQSA